MTRDEVLDELTNVTQWKRGGERAPHKPMLPLLALARCSRGESREAAYCDIQPNGHDPEFNNDVAARKELSHCRG